MQHPEFLALIKKGLGPSPRLDSRDNLAALVRSKGTEIFLNYDWIINRDFYMMCENNPAIEIDGGSQGVTVKAIET